MPILYGLVLTTRPQAVGGALCGDLDARRLAAAVYTERQAQLLRASASACARRSSVEYAMRYGEPSIAEVLDRMRRAGCDRLLVLPLYPAVRGEHDGTALDACRRRCARTGSAPELRVVQHFHDHPAYISALGEYVRDYWSANGRPECW